MYKKALMVLIVGLAIFYGAAMLKYLFFTQLGTINPSPLAALPTPPALLATEAVPIEAVPRIDVVFTIDSTGSMGDEIEVVKENIRNIINDISQGQPAPDVRYGIVVYRDRGDEYVTKYWQFTRELPKIQAALASIRAYGGGDKPESVNEALHVTLHKMEWDQQAKTKMIFLIGDAGPNNYPNDFRWEEEIKYAQQQNITVNTIACSGMEAHEQQVFNEISSNSNGLFAQLTYRQEYARADGSRVVVIEEGARKLEVSSGVAEREWVRGADELLARGDAKELSSSAAEYDEPSYASGGDGGATSDVVETTSSDGYIAAAKPAAEPPAAPRDMAEAKSDRGYAGETRARASGIVSAPVSNKTNNLNTVLAETIKSAARRQGVTYGTPLTSAFDLKGVDCNVKTPRQLLIDNRETLQSFLGTTAGVDLSRIDFNNQIVLAIFLGRSPADTTITVNSLHLHGNEVLVNVKRQAGASAPATTAPFQLIVLPRQVGSIKLDAKSFFVRLDIN
ncbi:MAG: vWA domain-containing protein [Acidobacteriota bacterium]